MLPLATIEQTIRQLLSRYHAEYALLIGSYARGEATEVQNFTLKTPNGP